MRSVKFITLSMTLLLAQMATTTPSPARADSTLVSVRPSTMNGWALGEVSTAELVPSSATAFVFGPGTPPIGNGGIQMTVTNAISHPIATRPMLGVRLDDLTKITYATLVGSPAVATELQFAIDLTATDSYVGDQGSIIFDPALQVTGVVSPGIWQEWDALNGRWWATPEAGALATECTAAAPCGMATILLRFPHIALHSLNGSVSLSARASATPYTTHVDDLIIGVNGSTTVYDFEPEIPCTAVCWVDASTGNDRFGGASPGAAKRSIQAAIDAVSPLGTVRVRPGDYHEVAANRTLDSGSGPHTFGLFVPATKFGITLQGVDSGNGAIGYWASVAATIVTSATNSPGPSGIFIEGDNVSIVGLRIAENGPTRDRTIEVIGDGFTLRDAEVSDPAGRVFIHDPRYNSGSGAAHVVRFLINGNRFSNGASVEVANGAGASGASSDRAITNNIFVQPFDQPSIVFTGPGTGLPGYNYPIGGANIGGNNFNNTAVPNGVHIRVRGDYDNSKFDWRSYWESNTYNRAVIAGAAPPDNVRAINLVDGPYLFDNTREIHTSIQNRIDMAQAGDTLLAKAGDYAERLTIGKALTINGAGAGVRAKNRVGAPSALRVTSGVTAAIVIQANDVTLNGFTFDATGSDAGWIATAHAGPGNPRYERLRILNNTLIGDAGGLDLHNQDDLLIEGNFFDRLGDDAVRVSAATALDAGSNHLVYRGNDSLNNAGAHLRTVGAGHHTLWMRDNRAAGDSAVLSGISEATIFYNTFAGASDPQGQLVLLEGNRQFTITANSFASIAAPAIAALGANCGLTITNNLIAANSVGITQNVALLDLRGVQSYTLVQGNVITVNGGNSGPMNGIAIDNAQGEMLIVSNTLRGGGPPLARAVALRRQIAAAGDLPPAAGIRLNAAMGASARVTITQNSITAFQNGLHRFGAAAGGSVTFTRNNLSGNFFHGVLNDSQDLFDAQCNWHGHASGPAGAGAGSGSPASQGVDFSPWLISPDLNSACQSLSLTIVMQVIGIAPPSPWAILGPSGVLTITAVGGQRTLSDISPGTFTLVQQPQPGYRTASVCSNGAFGTEALGVELQADAELVCTFTSTFIGGHIQLLSMVGNQARNQ